MLKKLRNLQVNFALIIFIAFSVKMLLFNATIADSLIVGILAGLYGYTQYLKRFQPYRLDDAVQKDLNEVKSALTKLNMVRSADKLKGQKYF